MSVLEPGPQQGGRPDLVDVEVTLNHSELFRADCKRLILDTDKACKRMQDNDSKRLDQRVRDIGFLKNELEQKLEEITQETETLITLQNRVTKALEASNEPLRVTNLCLEERMKRAHSERLHDDVDRELLKEREVTEGVVSLLQRVIEQISEQIRLNRSTKYQLEQDLKEKSEARHIDDSCSLMTTTSMKNLQKSKNKAAALSSLTVTLEQWENMSEINISKVEKQKASSQSLRALVESVLEQTTADVQKQVQATTAAIQLNIQEVKSAKNQMEEKMPKIQSEISSQQKMREDLRAAIIENEQFLSLAQARLALRRQRPVKEQCHDFVHTQLLTDVQQLTAHINILHEEVAQSEEQERALLRCQVKLQESIDARARSLYIDEVICLQHREPIIIHNF
ncbi:tektin-1 [Melanotaenia boesemani]|uniref:tektin-1 n=1 Tax=Melanotaenia boesemani TaxID=1250792 RepID=UPI001C0565FA|nr:tektin-1 [Melanotaenia boesemani]XP_041850395.1 tektin-1 [Melanotaenia boesemani]